MTAKEYEQFREIFLHNTLKLSDEKRIEYTEGIKTVTYYGTLKA